MSKNSMEPVIKENSSPEIWQVDVNGEIYETNLEEMSQWIADGSLLPIDKVKRGNLRWLEANKVPLLYGFFNAKELGIDPPNITTTVNKITQDTNQPVINQFVSNQNGNQTSSSSTNFDTQNAAQTFYSPQSTVLNEETVSNTSQNNCIIHPDAEPKFSCDTCSNLFCKSCPNTYGSVKICPMCGAMCKPIAEVIQTREVRQQCQNAVSKGFGLTDFGKALAYPFKFKASLIGGAVMFMFFTIGQSASGIGGVYMLVAAIFCAMLANMLTFGVLANTVDNFSQGNIESNFMPSFDDFNIWDDVLHPFLLCIGVYISSFGPFILVIFAMTFFFINSVKPTEFNKIDQKVVETTAPQLKPDYDAASQTSQIKAITDQIKEKNNEHNQNIENAENGGIDNLQTNPRNEEQEFADLNNQINQHRKQQLESVLGKTPETSEAETTQFIQKMMGAALPFLLIAGLAFLWGLFYMPAACAVAGYTRSFTSTINPMIGIDTIKRLGVDYWKVMAMTVILLIMSGLISIVLKIALSPFDLPRLGNIPAFAIGSLFTFYFSVVFSIVLGFALFKNASKLNIYK